MRANTRVNDPGERRLDLAPLSNQTMTMEFKGSLPCPASVALRAADR
jgi:hypothetical protein